MRRIIPILFSLVLAMGYIFAQDTAPDIKEGLNQLIKRAEEGDSKAIFELGRMHEKGYETIEKDSVKSITLLKKAASQGYAPAMNYLGYRYYLGEGIEKNTDSTLYWIRKAAFMDDLTAAGNLGYLLTEGEGVIHNEEEALDWLAIAADGGIVQAQYEMVELAKKIKTGKAYALLGDAYSKGQGVEYDHEKSMDYFHKGAMEGNPSAQFVIAELLEFFPDSFEGEEATYWYEKAAAQGVTDSESAYKELYSKPKEPIIEAESQNQ